MVTKAPSVGGIAVVLSFPNNQQLMCRHYTFLNSLLRSKGWSTSAREHPIQRALWAIELKRQPRATPELPSRIVTGGLDSYLRCQQEARRLRGQGANAFKAPSAALKPAGARGWVVEAGLREGPPRDGTVYVLYGAQPRMVGWKATDAGRPPSYLLRHVRHF